MKQLVFDATNAIIGIIILMILFYMLFLIFRSLRKFLKTKEVRKDREIVKKSLGEVLKKYRVQYKMTQEFVAESVGVSRQTVSKWETGASDPSTSNLFVLAKLYGTTAQKLLTEVNL